MTFTYAGDPALNDLANLRFTIGDTDTTDQQLSDEELNFLLSDSASVKGAAVVAVRRILALYARLVNKNVGDLRLAYSDRMKHYKVLLSELQRSLALSTGGVVAGGISKARKEAVEADDDRVVPDFEKGQFDFPGSGNVNTPNNDLLP